MKFRFPLSIAILLPVAATLVVVLGLTLFLSASSNIATVEQTLRDRQDEMIRVLTEQFSGSVRFAKMEPVQQSFEAYKADPDFGLAAAGAIDAAGNPVLEFGVDPALVGAGRASPVPGPKAHGVYPRLKASANSSEKMSASDRRRAAARSAP